MWNTILFDLDGTLTDPKVGITKAVALALDRFGITEAPENLTVAHHHRAAVVPAVPGGVRPAEGIADDVDLFRSLLVVQGRAEDAREGLGPCGYPGGEL